MHLTCALAFIAGGAIMFIYNFVVTYWGLALLIAGLALLGITIVKNRWVTTPPGGPAARIAELVIAATMAIYSATQHWTFPIGIYTVLTLAVGFAFFWERASDAKQVIYIDDKGIHLPVTSRKRFIDWVETNEVLLRYGTLSIECTDNRRFQWNIQNTTIDRKTLEDYCTGLVEANKSKRVTDDW